MCIVCGQRREPRCELTPGIRKELREKEKVRKAAAKAKSKGSDGFFLKGSELPSQLKKVRDPWDLCRGKDVFLDGPLSRAELGIANMCHWAPNCSTFSRARERPIPGVHNPPRPLRSEESPEGLEAEVLRLPKAKRQKLEDDTRMARMAAENCLEFHRSGKRFSLEHPGNSLARHLSSWKALEAEPGVFVRGERSRF